MMQHLRWEKRGRTFEGDVRGQRVYKSYVGQENVPTGTIGGQAQYAPYVWNPLTKIVKFATHELRFVAGGLEYWDDREKLFEFAFHCEKLSGGWQRSTTANASSIRVATPGSDRATEKIELSYDLQDAEQKSTVTVLAGGDARIRFKLETEAKQAGTHRLTMEWLGTGEKRPIWGRENTSPTHPTELVKIGYDLDRKIAWRWRAAESDTHLAESLGDRFKLYLNQGLYTQNQRRVTNPDSVGPLAIAADADDCASDSDGFCQDGADAGACTDPFYFYEWAGDGARHHVGHRWQDIDIGGAPTIDSGTQVTVDTTGVGDPAKTHILRLYCEDSNAPGAFSDGAGTDAHTRTMITGAGKFDDTEVTDLGWGGGGTTYNVAAENCIQAAVDEGHTYDGAGDHIVICIGTYIAFATWGDTPDLDGGELAWAYSHEHATEDPAELTIVYTPSAVDEEIALARGIFRFIKSRIFGRVN